MQTPAELEKAKDKVRKQYRAACKLIYGKGYDPREIENLISNISGYGNSNVFPCVQCHDQHCKEKGKPFYDCPMVNEFLEGCEVGQQHKIINKLEKLDIDQYQKTRKKFPTAEEQFK